MQTVDSRCLKRGITVAVGLATVAMAGCSTQVANYSEENTYHAADNASKIYAQNKAGASVSDDDLISVSTDLYLSVEPLDASINNDYPDTFNKSFSMYTQDKSDIFNIMAAVTDMTGIQVYFTPDAFNYITRLGDTPTERTGSSSGSSGSQAEMTPDAGGTPVLSGSGDFANILESYMDGEASEDVTDYSKKMLIDRLVRRVSYQGTLKNFFDSMLATTGLSWEYENGSVHVRRYVTRNFVIDAIPGGVELASTVSNDSGSDGKKSSDTTSNKATLDVWEDIDNAVDSMLSEGGNFAISQSSGTLMVTDTPQVVGKVERYIKDLNKMMTTRFSINTEIIEVELTDSDSLGIDWDLVYQNMMSRASLASTAGVADYAVNYTVDNGLQTSIMDPNSPWANTSAMINALQEQGRVSVKTSQTVITSNGQVAPIQVLNQTAYLAEISVETSEDGSNSYTLTPDTVTSGLTLNVMPKLLSNGNVMLHYNLDITTLQAMEEYGAGDNKIQLPETKSQNFLQRVPVKPGSKIMLSGFEQVKDDYRYSGKAARETGLLGGSQSGESNRVITLIIVSPQMIE